MEVLGDEIAKKVHPIEKPIIEQELEAIFENPQKPVIEKKPEEIEKKQIGNTGTFYKPQEKTTIVQNLSDNKSDFFSIIHNNRYNSLFSNKICIIIYKK